MSNVLPAADSRNGETRTTLMPNMPRITTADALTASPEITALAARHISGSPTVFSFSLKIGMNAAVNAPSPSNRRNRFGTMNANMNASVTHPAPMKLAYTISRTRPKTRLVMVAALIALEDLSSCDMLEHEHVLIAGKGKFRARQHGARQAPG